MIVSFQLTMPNAASWNGKWSGADRKYYIVKTLSKRFVDTNEHFKRLAEKGKDSWYYRWDDGWGASVIAEVIDSSEARKRRKVSAGFSGYGWMVTSIINKGKILASHETETAS